jgi:hypothetical protein
MEVENQNCDLVITVCNINESLIVGNQFFADQNVIINYKSLLLEGDNFVTPLYGTSETEKNAKVINLMNRNIIGENTLVCQLDKDLRLPGTYIYTPNKEMWGNKSTSTLVNLIDDVFDIGVKNDNDFEFIVPKGSVIGTLQEVRLNSIQEELETWNMNPDQRLELLIQQVKLNGNGNLNDEEKSEVKELLRKFHDIFSLSKKEMSLCSIYTHEIQLKTDDVVQCPHRPIPIHQVDIVMNLIEELEEMGIVEKCISEYRSPLILVTNKRWQSTSCF